MGEVSFTSRPPYSHGKKKKPAGIKCERGWVSPEQVCTVKRKKSFCNSTSSLPIFRLSYLGHISNEQLSSTFHRLGESDWRFAPFVFSNFSVQPTSLSDKQKITLHPFISLAARLMSKQRYTCPCNAVLPNTILFLHCHKENVPKTALYYGDI